MRSVIDDSDRGSDNNKDNSNGQIDALDSNGNKSNTRVNP